MKKRFISALPRIDSDFSPPLNVEKLLQVNELKFIEAAYIALLNRWPDVDGRKCYTALLKNGVGKIQILHQLFCSPERQALGIEPPGLREEFARRKLYVPENSLPVVSTDFVGAATQTEL